MIPSCGFIGTSPKQVLSSARFQMVPVILPRSITRGGLRRRVMGEPLVSRVIKPRKSSMWLLVDLNFLISIMTSALAS